MLADECCCSEASTRAGFRDHFSVTCPVFGIQL